MNVWKTKKRVYYTRILSRPNRYGNLESACSKVEVSWSARDNGKVVEGFETKRAAIAALAAEQGD